MPIIMWMSPFRSLPLSLSCLLIPALANQLLQRGALSSASIDEKAKKTDGRSGLDIETENRPGAYTRVSRGNAEP